MVRPNAVSDGRARSNVEISDEVQAASGWPVPGGVPPEGCVAWAVGVGAAIARRMADGKLHVVVTGRTQNKLDFVVKEIEAAGGSSR